MNNKTILGELCTFASSTATIVNNLVEAPGEICIAAQSAFSSIAESNAKTVVVAAVAGYGAFSGSMAATTASGVVSNGLCLAYANPMTACLMVVASKAYIKDPESFHDAGTSGLNVAKGLGSVGLGLAQDVYGFFASSSEKASSPEDLNQDTPSTPDSQEEAKPSKLYSALNYVSSGFKGLISGGLGLAKNASSFFASFSKKANIPEDLNQDISSTPDSPKEDDKNPNSSDNSTENEAGSPPEEGVKMYYSFLKLIYGQNLADIEVSGEEGWTVVSSSAEAA
jgi:hypothetical protein